MKVGVPFTGTQVPSIEGDRPPPRGSFLPPGHVSYCPEVQSLYIRHYCVLICRRVCTMGNGFCSAVAEENRNHGVHGDMLGKGAEGTGNRNHTDASGLANRFFPAVGQLCSRKKGDTLDSPSYQVDTAHNRRLAAPHHGFATGSCSLWISIQGQQSGRGTGQQVIFFKHHPETFLLSRALGFHAENSFMLKQCLC